MSQTNKEQQQRNQQRDQNQQTGRDTDRDQQRQGQSGIGNSNPAAANRPGDAGASGRNDDRSGPGTGNMRGNDLGRQDGDARSAEGRHNHADSGADMEEGNEERNPSASSQSRQQQQKQQQQQRGGEGQR